jgi:hypothetical protein
MACLFPQHAGLFLPQIIVVNEAGLMRPRLSMCFGPRTEAAGLKGSMPPIVSQSRSMPKAARRGTFRRAPYHLQGRQFCGDQLRAWFKNG